MIINKLKKYLISALLGSTPLLASESGKVRDITELSNAHASKYSRAEQAHIEMIDVLNTFQAKEEDTLQFVRGVQESIAQGKKPIEINPFFKEMDTAKLTAWCGMLEENTLKNLKNNELNRKMARQKLVAEAGILDLFEKIFSSYLEYLQSREDSLQELRDGMSSGQTGDWSFISTLPGMWYSDFNKYIAQTVIDRSFSIILSNYQRTSKAPLKII